MTTYAFVDESGETRLRGTIVPAPGGGSQTFREIAVPFAFDTPGILTGFPVYTGSANERIGNINIYVPVAWNGSTPGAHVLIEGETVGAADLASADLTAADTFYDDPANLHVLKIPNASITLDEGLYFFQAGTVVVVIDDGSGGDPGSTAGTASVHVQIITPQAS